MINIMKDRNSTIKEEKTFEETPQNQNDTKVTKKDFPTLGNAFKNQPQGPTIFEESKQREKKFSKKINYKTYNPWKEEQEKNSTVDVIDDRAISKKLNDISEKQDSEPVSFISSQKSQKSKNNKDWKKKNRGGKSKKEEKEKKLNEELFPSLGGGDKNEKTIFEISAEMNSKTTKLSDIIKEGARDDDEFPGLGDGGGKKVKKKGKKKRRW